MCHKILMQHHKSDTNPQGVGVVLRTQRLMSSFPPNRTFMRPTSRTPQWTWIASTGTLFPSADGKPDRCCR